jgi:hypothetical protein
MSHGMSTDISKLIDTGELKDLDIDDYLLERIRLIDFEHYRTAIHCGDKADLAHLSRKELLLHNIRRGRLEGRVYNQRILQYLDPSFYRLAYPELGLKDHIDAQKHWLYDGVFQKKAPNSVTNQIMESCIHLFQMGKVGSKSIEEALRNAGYAQHIMHLHFANEMITTYPDCYYSYPEIINNSANDIFFIAGVRDPIGRILSGWIESTKSHASTMNLGRLEELINDRDRLEASIAREVDIIADWFCHSFFCNLDVYSKPFDQEKGFVVISGARHKVFVYRIDKLDGLWGELSIFLGLDLSCTRINETKLKGRREQEIQNKLKTIKLSGEIIDMAFNNRYARHFWSADDIAEFKRLYGSPG